MEHVAYFSLGSNVGDREGYLRQALLQLRACGRLAQVSSLYQTEPVEFTDQAWFLNCAAALETSFSPQQLMAEALQIELHLGRQRTISKGPRKIDIDILLFGDEVVNAPGLTIPHPGMANRRFVLEPLAEIAPHAVHPLLHKTVASLLTELPAGQLVTPIRDSAWSKD